MKKVLFIALIAWSFLSCGENSQKTKKAEIIKNVQITKLKIEKIIKNNISSGELEPINEVTEVTKTGGKVIAINFKNGDAVKPGDVIVKLEEQSVESDYLKAKANYESKTSDFATKEISFKKFKQLRVEKYISEDEFLTQKSSYDLARADLETAKAEYLATKKDFDDLTMRAKINGIVTDLDEKLYMQLESKKEVFTVVDSKIMQIKTGVSVSEIFDMNVGSKAELIIDGADKVYYGVVSEINPVADKDSKKYMVKIDVENPDQRLKKGMYSKTLIYSGEKEAYVASKTALVVRDLFSYIYVIENGVAREIKVERGYANGDKIEIISPELKGEMDLVIEGQYLLADKDKVNILK